MQLQGVSQRMTKVFFIFTGTLSLILGIIGLFVPVLPTTPFILLSAGMYVKSSPELYNRMISHQFTARYLMVPGSGINKKAIFTAIAVMWIMILTAIFIEINNVIIIILLIFIGIIGTIFKLRLLHRSGNTGID